MTARLLPLWLLFIVAPAGAAEANGEGGVVWFPGSFEAARARAAEANKGLMVDVYATWCGPCHELDRTVFSRADVAEEARHWIPVKVDAEGAGGPELAERYHVVGFPTILFLSSEGEEIDRVFGLVPAEELIAAAAGFRAGKGTLAERAGDARARPLDLELALDVGFRYAVRGDAVEAKRHFARIFTARRLLQQSPKAVSRGAADVSRLGSRDDFTAVRQGAVADLAGGLEYVDSLLARAYYALGKYLYLRGKKDYPAALEILRDLKRRFPDSPEAKEVPYQLAVAHHRLGRTERAKRELEQYLAAAENETAAANAVAWFCYRENTLHPWGRSVAEAALAKDPGAAALWDTLAELRGAEGDAAGAVEAIEQAVHHDPDEPYYRRQLERFRAALVPVPPRDAPEPTAELPGSGG